MSDPNMPHRPIGLLDVEEERASVDLAGVVDERREIEPGAFRKVRSAIVTLLALIVLSYAVPGLETTRPWTSADPVPFWNLIGRELLGEGEGVAARADAVEDVQAIVRAVEDREGAPPVEDRVALRERGDGLPVYEGHPDDGLEVPRTIEDPSGDALDPFYASLARTDAGFAGAITRVTHWGDSAIGTDGITSAIRRRLQRRFGDAGHGFHLLQPPNLSYRHQNIRFETNGGWDLCFIIERCRKNGHYGLGGTVFVANGGAKSIFRTAGDDSPVGQKVSRFELWYRARPRGGKLEVKIDRELPVVIDTAAEEPEDRWYEVTLEDAAHRFRVRSTGGGLARAYGVVLERDGPGVVWDGMSLIGAFSSRLAEMDPDHFRSQLEHRGTNLVVLMFGGNDMVRDITMEQYREEYGRVFELVRGGQDPPACLVMSPLDHGQRKGARIETREIVPVMVQVQRELAFEHGCAFFDTFQAMGGDGSMGRWFRAEPPLGSGDLAHLNWRGHRAVGELVYLALARGYAEYRRRTDGG